VLARSASRGFVALLAKGHIFGRKPADFHQELSGRAALRAAIEKAPFPCAALLCSWRAKVFLAPISFSALLCRASLGPLPLGTVFTHGIVLQL
jgi:hypothetical protein